MALFSHSQFYSQKSKVSENKLYLIKCGANIDKWIICIHPLLFWIIDHQKGKNTIKICIPFNRLYFLIRWIEFNYVCLFFPSSTASMPMACLNLGQIDPFKRGFFCNDNSIRYRYHDSTVTTTMLSLVGLSLPLSSVSKLISRLWWIWCAGS